MFRRSFMEAFKVRKNANPSGQFGTISSNINAHSKFDRYMTRIGMYALVSLLMVNATRDFSFFYEIFFHLPSPVARTYYDKSIPSQIREANQEIIENWGKIHKAKQLLKTFEVIEM